MISDRYCLKQLGSSDDDKHSYVMSTQSKIKTTQMWAIQGLLSSYICFIYHLAPPIVATYRWGNFIFKFSEVRDPNSTPCKRWCGLQILQFKLGIKQKFLSITWLRWSIKFYLALLLTHAVHIRTFVKTQSMLGESTTLNFVKQLSQVIFFWCLEFFVLLNCDVLP